MPLIAFEEIAKRTGYKPAPTTNKPAPVASKTQEPVVKVVQSETSKPKITVTNKPYSTASNLQGSGVQPQITSPTEDFQKATTDQQMQPAVTSGVYQPTANPKKLAVPFELIAKQTGLKVTGVDGTPAPVPTKEVPLPSDTAESTPPSLLTTYKVALTPEEIRQRDDLEQDGLLKSLIKAPIKDLFVVPGVRVAQVLTEIARPDVQAGQRDVTIALPGLGDFNVRAQKTGVAGVKQIAGQGISSASWLIAPGKIAKVGKTIITDTVLASIKTGQPVVTAAVRNALWNTVKVGFKQGAVLGSLGGLGESLQQDKGWDDNAKDFVIGAVFGGAVGGATAGAGSLFSIVRNKTRYIQTLFEKELIANGVDPARAKLLASEGGFLQLPGGEKDAMEGLLAEARKYKTAEEFVKQFEYHGGQTPRQTIEKSPFGGGGVFSTPDLATAQKYGKEISYIYVGNKKIWDATTEQGTDSLLKFLKGVKPEKQVTKLKKAGYDGIRSHILDGNLDKVETQLFDKQPAYTKSQLTDIWKKANTKPTMPLPTQKERGVMKTVRTGKITTPQLKSEITAPENAGNRFYNVAKDKDAIAFAGAKIAEGVDKADAFVMSGQYNKNVVATGIELIKKYDAEGAQEHAYRLIDHLSKLATESGQGNQAWSLYNQLSPEGIVGFAKKQLGKAKVDVTDEFADQLRKQAQKVNSLADGTFEKNLETAVMLQMIRDKVPSTFLQKVSTFQTMSMLLNPKTVMRNILGNAVFAGMENISQAVGTPIDKLVSLATGKRTQGLPYLNVQAKGMKVGWLQAYEQVKRGVDLDADGKFGETRKAFKGKVGSKFQMALDVALKMPDKAFYQAAFDDSLRVQMKLAGAKVPTEEMIERAIFDGQYRTFNDSSMISKGLAGVKKGLNMLTGSEDFGAGDAVLKFPRIPGNLLSRGIAYTPVNFVNSVFQLAKPLFGKTFNQRSFVDSTSRGLVGTGLIGIGVILHKLGIITGKAKDDKDIRALENQTGVGQYKFNVSALKRYVLSGFDPNSTKMQDGDVMSSYDWLQPTSIGLAIGANIDEASKMKLDKKNIQSRLSSLAVSTLEGTQTLAEQPLLQGVTRPFKYAESLPEAALIALKGVPASFIPTIINQLRQSVDPNLRDTRDESWIKEALVNMPKNKVPGLSNDLPKSIDTLGRERTYSGNSFTRPIMAFLSPATITKVKTNPTSRLVMEIYEKTGDAKPAPRVVPLSQQIIKFKGVDENGEAITETQSIKITAKQANDMQKWVGQTTNTIFSNLTNNPAFMDAPDEEKAKYLTGLLSDINTVARIKFIGHQPTKASADVQMIYQMFP